MAERRYQVDRLDKSDRALELREKGCSYDVIANRLGVRPASVHDMIARAKQRRAKAASEGASA